MAEIDILNAAVTDGRIQSLVVRFKNAPPRTIDRETALTWARDGHSLIPVAGHGHSVTRGFVLSLIEVREEEFLRTDTRAEAADHVGLPGAH